MSIFRRWLPLVLLLPIIAASSGCATMNWPWAKDRQPRASAKNPVAQILCLWEPSRGRDADGMPCRGFAGQIIFLGNRNAAPVAIDGSMRFYVFTDGGNLEERTTPRMWDFDSESWNRHMTVSALGPTYSVFIPFTGDQTTQVTCSVRARLTPEVGQVTFSETASVILPGRKTVNSVEEATDLTERQSGGNVWSTESLAKTADASGEQSKMLRKTTIPLNPKNMIRDEQNGVVQEMAFGSGQAPAAGSTGSEIDPVLARMERLERLLEQSLQQQHVVPAAAVGRQESGVVQAGYESMTPEVDSYQPRTSDRATDRRPPFRGDRNSGSQSGDVSSARSAARSSRELHPLADDFSDELPPAPRRLTRAQTHPLLDESQ